MLSKANDVDFDFLDNLLVAKILRFPSKVFFLSDQVYALGASVSFSTRLALGYQR
jgi:hypothetical protein